MNHNKSYRKLGRRTDHRLAMLKNMTISLVKAERIETTLTRAKELRKFAEKAITLGKKYNASTDAAREHGQCGQSSQNNAFCFHNCFFLD